MRKRIKPGWAGGISLWVMAALLLGGCAFMQRTERPSDVVATDRGTLIYKEKYEFKRPPAGYSMLKNEEGGDFEIGFFKIEKGDFPSQTTYIYDDLPFGSSRNLEERARQYCTRFLFNTGMFPEVKNREKTEVAGLPALAIYLEGENPSQAEKAKSKVYLLKKGDRVISFLCTQWRPLKGTYDPAGFNDFEEFVKSFKFLKPSFYERFEDQLKQAGL